MAIYVAIIAVSFPLTHLRVPLQIPFGTFSENICDAAMRMNVTFSKSKVKIFFSKNIIRIFSRNIPVELCYWK